MNNVYVDHLIECNDIAKEQKETLLQVGLRLSPFVIPLVFSNQLNQLKFFRSVSKRIDPMVDELISPFIEDGVVRLSQEFDNVAISLKKEIVKNPYYVNNFYINNSPFLIRGKIWTNLEAIDDFNNLNKSLMDEFIRLWQQIIQSVPMLSTLQIVKYRTINVLPTKEDYLTNLKEQGRIRKLISNYHTEYASLI